MFLPCLLESIVPAECVEEEGTDLTLHLVKQIQFLMKRHKIGRDVYGTDHQQVLGVDREALPGHGHHPYNPVKEIRDPQTGSHGEKEFLDMCENIILWSVK